MESRGGGGDGVSAKKYLAQSQPSEELGDTPAGQAGASRERRVTPCGPAEGQATGCVGLRTIPPTLGQPKKAMLINAGHLIDFFSFSNRTRKQNSKTY